MDIHYTMGKITASLWALALGQGNLRQRVPEACAELMSAGYRTGFEEPFGRIEAIMAKVFKGDWTRVSDAELREIALAIWRLNERLS